MQRTSLMTLGFVLIFLGIQLALVDSYLLTPRFANFMAEQRNLAQVGSAPPIVRNQYQQPQSPYQQAGFQVPQQLPPVLATTPAIQRTISPPRWLCWPTLFLGTVVLLHGHTVQRYTACSFRKSEHAIKTLVEAFENGSLVALSKTLSASVFFCKPGITRLLRSLTPASCPKLYSAPPSPLQNSAVSCPQTRLEES